MMLNAYAINIWNLIYRYNCIKTQNCIFNFSTFLTPYVKIQLQKLIIETSFAANKLNIRMSAPQIKIYSFTTNYIKFNSHCPKLISIINNNFMLHFIATSFDPLKVFSTIIKASLRRHQWKETSISNTNPPTAIL